MQWLMPTSGNIKSFNYGIDDENYHHLDTQDYAVCFRRAAGHCKIAYVPANDGESFYLSFTPSTPTIKSRAGESGCPADFLIIPGGSNAKNGQGLCQVSSTMCNVMLWYTAFQSPSPVATPNLGRYCGRRLNCHSDSASNSAIYS